MTLESFLEHVNQRKPLNTPEIFQFLNEMNDEARRITAELNNAYHNMDEIRELFSRLSGKPVDPSFRIFPPFYTDFGKNIHVGKNVFINACCHFQDQGGITVGDDCLIGHNVVFATLNHFIEPAERASMHPAPIVLGKKVWVEFNHSARCYDRRQLYYCRRFCCHQRCSGQYHCRRRSRPYPSQLGC